MLKFDGVSSFYANYLEVMNPRISLHQDKPDTVLISYDGKGEKKIKHEAFCPTLSANNVRTPHRDVEINFKVESAFHCLVSKFYADYPHLSNVSFFKLGQKIRGQDDATKVLIEIYNILRLIRNKFHHDKFGGLSWDDHRNLTVKGDENLVITENGVRLSIYIVWYCLKNNMKHLYNRIVLNYLYADLVKNVKKISYGFDNKKTTSLKSLNNQWKTITHSNRNIVQGEIIEICNNGYMIDRQKCFISDFVPDTNGEEKLMECLYRRLDYQFQINGTEYLIPDEYFFNKGDGIKAFISEDDLKKFIYYPLEIANF
ncbi:hypothetical protein [Acinetobacter larvae]|uniref:Uncharacterized protein n=1 Tax=Acinetobacter larvae TaxID=1789224 RepID=A0A1B2LZA5_9GAMM|nr:hypothetical protein [Acinetobacter larvae]AOA58266.1 hypothetical protein BFG52_07790 [Acinetobacter larvae]